MASVRKGSGPQPDLCGQIRDLVSRYSESVSIFHEFIQNADDAGASMIRFILDCRSHVSLADPRTGPNGEADISQILGPALLICNDRRFTPDDFEGIQKPFKSGKLNDITAAGRFGVGFSVSYSVTDYPSFISCDQLHVFDPRKNSVHAEGLPGAKYIVNADLWSSHRVLLDSFTCAGLAHGCCDHDGAIFRLPLRTDAQSRDKNHPIKDVPFTFEDFHALVRDLEKEAASVLLFLKHLNRIEVDCVREDASRYQVLEITTENADEVRGRRERLLNQAKASSDGETQPSEPYEHSVRVTTHDASSRYRWLVTNGIYGTDNAWSQAKELQGKGQKALPWVGVATQLPRSESGQCTHGPVDGMAFCFLPVHSACTGLPVHVHGYFFPESDRRRLVTDVGTRDQDLEIKATWNRTLLDECIPLAYVRLIQALKERVEVASACTYYSVWPDASKSTDDWCRIASAFYRIAASEPLIRCTPANGSDWAPVGDLYLCEEKSDVASIHDALCADPSVFRIPSPLLPKHVAAGCVAANRRLHRMSPDYVCNQLRIQQDNAVQLGEAPKNCLKRREWLAPLLQYCLNADPEQDLPGVQLALAADGMLRGFGRTACGPMLIGDTRQRKLLGGRPDWFLDAELARQAGIAKNIGALVQLVDVRCFVERLSKILDPNQTCKAVRFHADSHDEPNAAWLQEVYAYLAEHAPDANKAIHEHSANLPLLPDDSGHLAMACRSDSPLLLDSKEAGNTELCRSLHRLGVRIIAGPDGLVDAIRRFYKAVPPDSVVPRLAADTLIASLDANSGTWSDLTLDDVEPVLDYLDDHRDTISKERIELAQKLPLFPTQTRKPVRIADKGVFLCDDAQNLPCDVMLLDTRWSKLFRALKAQRLTDETLIHDHILPRFSKYEGGEQRKLLLWMRDHTPKDKELESEIGRSQLFECLHGKGLCEATEAYWRDHVDARDVLGDVAALLSTDYDEGKERWVEFLQRVGAPKQLRPEHIHQRLQTLCTKAQEEGVDATRAELGRVLTYLNKHWAEDESLHELKDWLHDEAWIVPDANVAACPVSAMEPASRLYRPSELIWHRMANLCSSQRRIAPRMDERFIEAIGVQKTVDPQVVILHFKAVLSAWAQNGHSGLSPKHMIESVCCIYRHFGENADSFTEPLDEFRDRECLWDPNDNDLRFWRPQHTFKTDVPFFGKYRKCIHFSTGGEDQRLDRAYVLLGRQDKAGIKDIVTFLRELEQEYGGEPLGSGDLELVLQCMRKLEELLSDSHTEQFPVPTIEGRLVSVRRVCFNDAPWFAENLRDVDLLHGDLGNASARKLGVGFLSLVITETLAEKTTPVSEASDLAKWCQPRQECLRSPEFTQGLRRLIASVDDCDAAGAGLGLLRRCAGIQVLGVQSISTNLNIVRDGQKQEVGESPDCEAFIEDRDEPVTIYVSHKADKQKAFFIAERLVQRLGLRERKSELEKMIVEDSSAIDALLTSLKVPTLRETEYREPVAEPSKPISVESVRPSGDEEDVAERSVAATHADAVNGQPHCNTNEATTTPESQGQIPLPGVRTPTQAAQGYAPHHVASASVPTRDSGSRPGPVQQHAGQPHSRESTTESPCVHGGPPAISTGAGGEAGEPGYVRTGSPRPRGPKPAVAAPNGAGHGTREHRVHDRENMQKRRRWRGRVSTYLVAPGSDEPDAVSDGQTDAAKREVEEAAINAAMWCESEEGRHSKPQPSNHQGFDILSVDNDGADPRYIEVKGLRGEWEDSGVLLTPPEYDTALCEGDAYWLYVVECATTSPKVYRIQNPVQRTTEYHLDAGWRELAYGHTGHPTIDGKSLPNPPVVQRSTLQMVPALVQRPTKGARILWRDGRLGAIWSCSETRKQYMLEVHLDDGEEVHGLFNATTMRILQPDSPRRR